MPLQLTRGQRKVAATTDKHHVRDVKQGVGRNRGDNQHCLATQGERGPAYEGGTKEAPREGSQATTDTTNRETPTGGDGGHVSATTIIFRTNHTTEETTVIDVGTKTVDPVETINLMNIEKIHKVDQKHGFNEGYLIDEGSAHVQKRNDVCGDQHAHAHRDETGTAIGEVEIAPRLPLEIHRKTIMAIVDTGASVNLIRTDVVRGKWQKPVNVTLRLLAKGKTVKDRDVIDLTASLGGTPVY